MQPRELLDRYACGQRDFRGVVAHRGDLSEACLACADFEGGNSSEDMP